VHLHQDWLQLALVNLAVFIYRVYGHNSNESKETITGKLHSEGYTRKNRIVGKCLTTKTQKEHILMNSSFSHKGMNIDHVLTEHYPQAKIVIGYVLYRLQHRGNSPFPSNSLY
jgi:hypothetical protein